MDFGGNLRCDDCDLVRFGTKALRWPSSDGRGNPVILLPVIAGFAIVLQSGLNRMVASRLGLATSLLINGIVVLILSILLYLWGTRSETANGFAGGLFQVKGGIQSALIEPRLLISGICGFVIITSIPWSIMRMGAVSSIVIVVASQIAGSLIWDWSMEGLPPSSMKLAGAGLCLLGAWLAVSR